MKIDPISIVQRESKEKVADMCGSDYARSVADLLASLPAKGAGADLRDAVRAIAVAVRTKRPVVVGLGAHVVKCGLSPAIIDLIERGVITCLALNGAAAIHDVEFALFGETSEDVVSGLAKGTYGMTAETADFLNLAAVDAARASASVGRLLGERLADSPHASVSILAAAARQDVAVTLHVAIGTDFIHVHPSADGAAWGGCSLRDFHVLAEHLREAVNGGALLNIGSAVILPEVYLKCFAMLRNRRIGFDDFTSINLDFLRQYRAMEQVVNRVRALGGKGISLTGHHEIMVPLIAGGVVAAIAEEGGADAG